MIYDVYVFGSTRENFDFELIDSMKLILVIIELKIKWFMFKYINVKVSWTINLNLKINYRTKC